MADVFISYAAEDRAQAELLARALAGEGWEVWWDRSITPGKHFDEVIQAELSAARCVVVVWSRVSVARHWVRAEAHEALERQVLIPVRLGEVKPPLPFNLVQAVTLEGWRGDASHPAFRSLAGAVEGLLGAPPKRRKKEPARRRPKKSVRRPRQTAVAPPAPEPAPPAAPDPARAEDANSARGPQRLFAPRAGRAGMPYIYTEEALLAVNVALSTQRPLLVRGPGGSGKTALARAVARDLGRRYYEEALTPRTRPRDLLWRPRTPRQTIETTSVPAHTSAAPSPYILPGVLWWAFDAESARRHGGAEAGGPHGREQDGGDDAVVLLDGIDEVDDFFLIDLAGVLGSRQFRLEELGLTVTGKADVLLVMTSGEGRQLPGSFVRRCVALTLPPPDERRLCEIAGAYFPHASADLVRQVAQTFVERSGGAEPGSAGGLHISKFLDAVRACDRLGIRPGDAEWERVMSM